MLCLLSAGAEAGSAQDYNRPREGYSSGSIGFSLRGARFYTGRTYYTKQDVWLCHFCNLARAQQIAQQKKRSQAVAAAVLIIGLLAFAVVQISQISQARRTEPNIQQSQANLVQDSAKQAVPSPNETISVQNRLIELGYLAGTADGAWGPRSRTALRAFKVANGLVADDKWDEPASKRLFSTAAARAPAPTAGR